MLSTKLVVPLTLVLGLAVAGPAGAKSVSAAHAPVAHAHAAQAESDDAPVLPSRVANAIRRTQNALDSAESHLDDGEYSQAITALRSVRGNMYRGDRAARIQLAAPAVDEDAPDGTPAPSDSVVAVLGEEHTVITTVAGLFDANSQGVVDALTHTLYRTLDARDALLNGVIALDPEGAGAAYADAMPDTADQYPDEVANLTEALASDQLSAGGQKVLRPALAQVTATANVFNTAFGGGE
jgi:hypothetical protein